MRDCIKSCRKVKKDEDGDEALVSSKQEVICDFDKGGLSAMVSS